MSYEPKRQGGRDSYPSGVDIVRETLAALTAPLQRVASTPISALGYGIDLVCGDDLDSSLRETRTDTTESLAQDLYHRIVTARGTLPDDPDYGLDIVDMLSRGATQVELTILPARLANELTRDDRVNDVSVQIDQQGMYTFAITILVTPEDPALKPFALIVTLTDGQTLLQLEASP